MVTIIFAHPWHGSFNKLILSTICSKFEETGKKYTILDLYKDKFDPVISEEELALYNKGKYIDPLVGHYQETLKKTDEIIFIFPNWWSDMPAIMKGFFDKVLLKDFAFNYEGGFNPLLNIEKTTVITTCEHPTSFFKFMVEEGIIKSMLEPVGIRNGVWLNCENTSKGTDENRHFFLQKIIKDI